MDNKSLKKAFSELSTPLIADACVKLGVFMRVAPIGIKPLVPGWQIAGSELAKTFGFADYHRTIAFVNALAWVAHRQDHHPDLSVHFNRCRVAWSTHSAGGLTLNDFICAARTESLTA